MPTPTTYIGYATLGDVEEQAILAALRIHLNTERNRKRFCVSAGTAANKENILRGYIGTNA